MKPGRVAACAATAAALIALSACSNDSPSGSGDEEPKPEKTQAKKPEDLSTDELSQLLAGCFDAAIVADGEEWDSDPYDTKGAYHRGQHPTGYISSIDISEKNIATVYFPAEMYPAQDDVGGTGRLIGEPGLVENGCQIELGRDRGVTIPADTFDPPAKPANDVPEKWNTEQRDEFWKTYLEDSQYELAEAAPQQYAGQPEEMGKQIPDLVKSTKVPIPGINDSTQADYDKLQKTSDTEVVPS